MTRVKKKKKKSRRERKQKTFYEKERVSIDIHARTRAGCANGKGEVKDKDLTGTDVELFPKFHRFHWLTKLSRNPRFTNGEKELKDMVPDRY